MDYVICLLYYTVNINLKTKSYGHGTIYHQ